MSLAKTAVLGIIWTVGSRFVGLIATFVLIRMLELPEIFGEFAIVHVITLNAHYLSNLGVDRYLVSYPKAGRSLAFHATALHLITGAIALSLVLVFRDFLTRSAGGTALALSFVPGMVLAVAFERLGQIPEKILTRDMRFKAISLIRTAGEFIYAGVALGFAQEGWGGMSLVFGNVARSGFQTIAFIAVADRRDWLLPCRLHKNSYVEMLRFGIPLSLGSMLNLVARTWDNILVGKIFGPSSLGLYKQAYNFADLPAIQIGEAVADVLLPSFAHMDGIEHRRVALVRATGLLMLVMAPIAIGLGAVADTLVQLLLPVQWYPVAPLLSVLSAMAVLRPVGWIYGTYLQSQGNTRAIFYLEIVKAIAVIGGLLLFAKISLLWACVGVGIGFAIETVLSMWAVQRTDGIKVSRSMFSMIGPLLACVPMVFAVLGVRHFCLEMQGWPLIVSLLAEIACGALAFIPAALVLARTTSLDFISLIKRVLPGGQADDMDLGDIAEVLTGEVLIADVTGGKTDKTEETD